MLAPPCWFPGNQLAAVREPLDTMVKMSSGFCHLLTGILSLVMTADWSYLCRQSSSQNDYQPEAPGLCGWAHGGKAGPHSGWHWRNAGQETGRQRLWQGLFWADENVLIRGGREEAEECSRKNVLGCYFKPSEGHLYFVLWSSELLVASARHSPRVVLELSSTRTAPFVMLVVTISCSRAYWLLVKICSEDMPCDNLAGAKQLWIWSELGSSDCLGTTICCFEFGGSVIETYLDVIACHMWAH